ncbi:hypothetical protein JW960_04225 [candidate division KSB1 bacterium]|nr:hypothetical protein [candidate division KSB1 bacterium]
MLRYVITVIIVCFSLSVLHAQSGQVEIGQWKHTSLHGGLSMQHMYRSQETILRSGVAEKPVMQDFNGQIRLNSRSYVWHPNFMQINIDADYNPGIKNEQFLVIPNRSETRTTEKFRIETVIFDMRPLAFNLFGGLSHGYINREYASSVENNRQDYGGGLSFRNRFVPLTVHYQNANWKQNELNTSRLYTNNRENIRTDINKSFGKLDANKFSYNYDDYQRSYGDAGSVRNFTSNFQFENRLAFTERRKSYWNSLMNYRTQAGSQSYDRLQINENTRIQLPAQFSAIALYRYTDYEQNLFSNKQQSVTGRLEHQLFLSLHSQIYHEYIDIQHTSYTEFINRSGAGFDYQKIIPTGLFKLAYEFQYRNDHHNSNPGILSITSEMHELQDTRIVLLENPGIDPASVVIWDEDRTIRFQENIDYLIFTRENYLQIQRLPGGQISDGQSVLVDYTAIRINSYQFDTNTHAFRASVQLFNRLLETYLRTEEQDYTNVDNAAQQILKTITRQVYGVRLQWKDISAGWEHDNYESNIVPYRSARYFMTVSHTMGTALTTFISGNWRDYVLTHDDEQQQFADISGRILYAWTRSTTASLDGGYRFQDGRGIDLKLTNVRFQLSNRFRELIMTVGIDVYRRDFSGETLNYNGGFIRIERTF